jgi:hypothetical protein
VEKKTPPPQLPAKTSICFPLGITAMDQISGTVMPELAESHVVPLSVERNIPSPMVPAKMLAPPFPSGLAAME